MLAKGCWIGTPFEPVAGASECWKVMDAHNGSCAVRHPVVNESSFTSGAEVKEKRAYARLSPR
jgi:hypothetical protein